MAAAFALAAVAAASAAFKSCGEDSGARAITSPRYGSRTSYVFTPSRHSPPMSILTVATICALFILYRGGDDDERQVGDPVVADRVGNAGRNEDDVVLAHGLSLAFDLHRALAFQHVIDLLLHAVGVRLHIGHGLIRRDAIVDEARTGGFRTHERLGQRAAEMAGVLLPRRLDDVADHCARGALLVHRDHLTCFLPKTGSVWGIGGSAQAPVPGGRMLASTCTSIRHGLSSFTACSNAPLKSCDLVTVRPSTPAALA